MATVLAEPTGIAAEEMVHFSIPILKWEEDADGDLIVKGIATDGTVDSDSQIVDSEWSAKALQAWIATGGNVRQSHDPHRPVGKGLKVECNKDNTGKHYVTSLVVDPLAQKLVKKGVLTAYSVGISRPVIKHDPTGRARGGIIVDGELAELSLVDRPSNKSSYLELAKSAANGECEFVQKMVADEAVKVDEPAVQKSVDVSSFDADLFTFTPNDMAKMLKTKILEQHYQELAADAEKRDFDRGVGGGVDRDKLPASDFAGPHRSFPVVSQSDVSDAMHLAGHADNPAAVRANIADIAHDKGLDVPKEDIPDLVKDPATMAPQSVGQPGDAASASPGKEIPQLDADGDCDGDGDATDGIPKAAKPKKVKPGKKGKNLPPWLNKPADDSSDKCDAPDPKSASGATDAHDMERAPLGTLMESPAPASMKAQEAVALRYKTIGIDSELGALHDFACPAYNPAEVDACHPYADVSTLVNENLWQRKALSAATGPDIGAALGAQRAWQAAAILKSADMDDLNAFRLEMHKAFRDANPGVASFPSPGTVSPQRFHRPVITDGHARHDVGGYGSPNTSSMIPDSAPNAHGFGRPPLGDGNASPSPSFMKATQPYPDRQGAPTRLDYPQMESDKARRSLVMLHDHLQHQFPQGCPMIEQDAYRQEAPIPVGPIAGLGKAVETGTVERAASNPGQEQEVLGDIFKYIRKLERRVQAGEITEQQARDKLSKRTAEKYARDLAKDVQKGMTSIDEVRKLLGLEPVVEKAAAPVEGVNDRVSDNDGHSQPESITTKGMTPDVMKAMMGEILAPLQEQIAAQQQMISEYQQKMDAQQEQLKTYDKRWEALANTADPSTNGFSGLAMRKASPAGVANKQAEVSEHVQGMMMRQLERTWRTSENPAEREAAYSALNKMKNPFE